MFDCGVYGDEELTELLLRTLESGWLKVWDIRIFMQSGDKTLE